MGIKSRFIVLEGMDFCGKTTITLKLTEHFEALGLTVVRTREPGGTPLGENLRSLLLCNSTDILPLTELLMFMSARNEHLQTIILPALDEGKVVISDRFIGSSYVYQGAGKHLGDEAVTKAFANLHTSQVTQALSQHMQTFVLDISFEESRRRAGLRGEPANRLDVVREQYYHNMRAAFKALPEMNSTTLFQKNFHTVDAERSVDEIFKHILTKIEEA